MELADTSAWTNRHKSEVVANEFADKLVAGRVATCDPVVFELLRAARDRAQVVRRRGDLLGLRSVAIGPRVWLRTLDVLELLAERGPLHHRGFPLADVLVAAAAERAELPVLHYDRHFELIGEVTGQPMRAIAPLGSLG